MPEVQTLSVEALRETTTPIEIARGNGLIVLHCFLERISATHDEYGPMERTGRELELEARLLSAQIALNTNADWLQSEMLAFVPVEGDASRLPNSQELEARQKNVLRRQKKLVVDLNANNDLQLKNKAQRIAFLTSGWNLTQKAKDGADEALPITTANILQWFSPILIVGILAQIEGAIFGPLEMRGDSGT